MALVETVGAANADTYQTAEGAATYFVARLNGDSWPADDTGKCEQALLTAMRIVEGLAWIGQRATGEQSLEWPRVAYCPQERERRGKRLSGYETLSVGGAGLYDKRGRLWTSSVIPQPVKDAQCEVAYAMLLDPSLNDPVLIQTILKSGNLNIDHSKPALSRLRMAYEALNGLVIGGTRLCLS